MENLIPVLALASTLFMTGLIWFVQVVHYPLFMEVGDELFAHYELVHPRKTGCIVAPVMLIELGTSVLWLFVSGFSISLILGLILLVMIWLSTFRIQVPLHRQLIKSFDSVKIKQLVKSNWIRTSAWSLKSLIYLFQIFS